MVVNPVSAGTANAAARAVVLPFMLCPTDTYNRRPYNGSKGQRMVAFGDNWARGNYAINGGLGYMTTNCAMGCFWTAGTAASPSWLTPQVRGVSGVNCSLRPADVTDGASNTILLGEIRAGLTDYDNRGVWAMGNACGSSLWATGGLFMADDNGPNPTGTGGDDNADCAMLWAAFGDPSDYTKAFNVLRMGMSCFPGNNWQQGVRSLHKGGVHVCMCDGSARWISDFIQSSGSTLIGKDGQPANGSNTPYTVNYAVWDRLIASGDGQPVSADSF